MAEIPPPARAFQHSLVAITAHTSTDNRIKGYTARGWGQTLKLKPNQCPDHRMEETIRNTVDFKTSFH